MVLEPEPHVPGISRGEVRGMDGSECWGMTHPGIVTGDMWVQDKDRRNLSCLKLDLAGCVAVAELAMAMAQVLRNQAADLQVVDSQ